MYNKCLAVVVIHHHERWMSGSVSNDLNAFYYPGLDTLPENYSSDPNSPHHQLIATTTHPSDVPTVQQDDDPSRSDSMNNSLAETAIEPILIEHSMCGGNKMICDSIDDQQNAPHHFSADSRTIDTFHSSSTPDTSMRQPPTNQPPPLPIPACCRSADLHRNAPDMASDGCGHALSCSTSIICRICHNTDRVDR